MMYAKQLAKSFGAKVILGPMEGATWQNYRFTTANNADIFFTEYKHKPYYPNQFLSNGFKDISTYSSTIDHNIEVNLNRLEEFKERFANDELTVRQIDLEKFEYE